MKNLNEYNKNLWVPKFKKTDIFKKLENDFDSVLFEANNTSAWCGTPRETLGSLSTASGTIFYYLEKLFEIKPESVYDIGCGWNIFKKYYPQIVGIGAEDPKSHTFYADIHDYFDADFVNGHKNYFESIFSINSLHFRPLSELNEILVNFFTVIKPGGRGFIALNLQRFIDKTDVDELNSLFNTTMPTDYQLKKFVRETIENFFIQTMAVPVIIDILDFSEINRDEFLDGNIRLVFDKIEN